MFYSNRLWSPTVSKSSLNVTVVFGSVSRCTSLHLVTTVSALCNRISHCNFVPADYNSFCT